MIVAHREFISIFDLRDTNGNIKKTIEHDDEVKLIQTVNYKGDYQKQ
jgi:spore maturation protein CgeB